MSIVGANGSGKSTLCNAIRGSVPHFTNGQLSGQVHVLGKSVPDTPLGDLARDAGYVLQNPFTQMSGVARTVYEELAYGLGNLGVSPDEMRARVEAMLADTDLDVLRDRNPFQRPAASGAGGAGVDPGDGPADPDTTNSPPASSIRDHRPGCSRSSIACRPRAAPSCSSSTRWSTSPG